MKTLNKTLIIIFLLFGGALHANDNIEDMLIINRNFLNLEYQRASTSSFFNYSGSQTYEIPDSIDIFHRKEYTYESKHNIIQLAASQKLLGTKNLNFYMGLTLPLQFNSYENLHKRLHDSIPDLIESYSNTIVPYIAIKTGVDFKFANFYLLGGVTYNASLASKDHFQIFDTYYSNIIPELSFIYDAKMSYFNLDLAYKKYLDGNISDEFLARFAVGLTTVESSVLRTYLEYSRSLDPINTNIKFLPEKYQLQSENLKLGIDFQLLIEKTLVPRLAYELVMSGKNNQIYSKFSIGAGIKIGFLK